MQDKNISHPFQGAFTKGRRSTDHIFVSNTLIDQAKHKGHPLYAAFIDLQKAYDSVNRPLRFREMIMCGLEPQFCKLVENMYIKASSRIKLGAKLGQSFTTSVGLRQGDPLPPLLFNMFTADIIFTFKSNCDPPVLHDLPIPSIQFSDNICNFSTSMQGLHNSIHTTLEYYKANKLSVNISKSCFTVYNCKDSNPPPPPQAIVIDGQALQYDTSPCYLGACLSNSRGDFNSIMIRKATKAAYALSATLDNSASATIINKLFSQLIEPILLYGAEQWLPYINPRKINQVGPTETFANLNTKLPTETV